MSESTTTMSSSTTKESSPLSQPQLQVEKKPLTVPIRLGLSLCSYQGTVEALLNRNQSVILGGNLNSQSFFLEGRQYKKLNHEGLFLSGRMSSRGHLGATWGYRESHNDLGVITAHVGAYTNNQLQLKPTLGVKWELVWE